MLHMRFTLVNVRRIIKQLVPIVVNLITQYLRDVFWRQAEEFADESEIIYAERFNDIKVKFTK